MENGRVELGEQLFREALFDMRTYIEQEEKQVQLLFIGKDDEGFLAIYKYSFGELWECDGFAAIGSGETIAEAALFQRGIVETLPLPHVAYAVYEAKRLGEITPGVGISTSMTVVDLTEDEQEHLRWRHVGREGLEFLESQLRERFGPQKYEYTPLPKEFICGTNIMPNKTNLEESRSVPDSG